MNITAFCIDFQTKDNVLKSQSDLRTLKMQRPVLKEGSTSLVIPGPCQKGTFSTSTQISQVIFINVSYRNHNFWKDGEKVLIRTLNLGTED